MPSLFVLFYRPSRISLWTPQETKLTHWPLLHTNTFPRVSEMGTVFLWEFHWIYTKDSSTSLVFFHVTCMTILLHRMLSCVFRLIIIILFSVVLSSFYVYHCVLSSYWHDLAPTLWALWIAMWKWVASFTTSCSLLLRPFGTLSLVSYL